MALGTIREEVSHKLTGSSLVILSEPVWPSGKAGKRKDLGSIPLRLSFLFKKAVVL